MNEQPNDADRLAEAALRAVDGADDGERHLDDNQVAAYAHRTMSEDARTAATEHLATCAPCRRLVLEVSEFAPAPVTASAQTRVRQLWPWVLAAGVVGVLVVYGAWWRARGWSEEDVRAWLARDGVSATAARVAQAEPLAAFRAPDEGLTRDDPLVRNHHDDDAIRPLRPGGTILGDGPIRFRWRLPEGLDAATLTLRCLWADDEVRIPVGNRSEFEVPAARFPRDVPIRWSLVRVVDGRRIKSESRRFRLASAAVRDACRAERVALDRALAALEGQPQFDDLRAVLRANLLERKTLALDALDALRSVTAPDPDVLRRIRSLQRVCGLAPTGSDSSSPSADR